MKKSKQGFTIIEMMIVITLISMLSILLISNGNFAIEKADKTSTLVEIGVYQVAIESIVRTSPNTPSSIIDLVSSLNNELDGQFRVQQLDNHIESVSRTNKTNDKFEIYTDNFVSYKIECGKYGKEIWVTKEDGLYEERVYTN